MRPPIKDLPDWMGENTNDNENNTLQAEDEEPEAFDCELDDLSEEPDDGHTDIPGTLDYSELPDGDGDMGRA